MRPGLRRLPWVICGLTLPLLVVTLVFTVRNGSFAADALFIAIAVAMMLGYVSVGALVASRLPASPIGWLLMTTGVVFLLAAFLEEYTTYALVTDPGSLPFVDVAVWTVNWLFLLAVAPVPLLLALFPTGSVASPRWRWLPAATVAVFALGMVGTILREGTVDVTDARDPLNPTGVDALTPVLRPLSWFVGIAGISLAIAAVVSLVQRYRAARGEERQQIRWLAYVGLLAAVLFLLTALTSIGFEQNESSVLNDALFFAFFLLMGIGIPVACAIAVLRYRLWDLDIVLKKALVAAVLVLLLTAASLVFLLVIGGILVRPVAESPGWVLAAGVCGGVLAWPLLRLSRRIADRIVYGGRATPYEVLTEFSGRMAESYATDDVLPRMAAILGEGSGAERVTIWLQVGRELRPTASWPAANAVPEPRPSGELSDLDPGTFEVRHQGEPLGAITVAMPANDPMNPSKERLIRDLASQAGLVLRNVRLIEELRASRRRLVAAQDEGRRRLERNIHDGAQQQLVALSVKVRLAQGLLERDPRKTAGLLEQLQADATDALENLRDLARGIYPPLLADQGLAAALSAQARKAPVPVEIAPDGVGRYEQEVEAAVYFCCLEAMQNVAKYAKASRVSLALAHRGDQLTFSVVDDGVGFDVERAPRGLGLQGMADRLEAIGGSLEVASVPGGGTTVAGRVPVESTAPPPDPG
jgi:signal transduction histidine kinase